MISNKKETIAFTHLFLTTNLVSTSKIFLLKINLKTNSISKNLVNKMIPYWETTNNNIIGLGYKWYPIFISTEQDIMQNIEYHIRPFVHVFATTDFTSSIKYDEDEIARQITAEHKFLNAQEIANTINTFKTNVQKENFNHHCFVGFMHADDTFELIINDTTLHFNQLNCLAFRQIRTKRYNIIPQLKTQSGKDAKIFNYHLNILIIPKY